MKFTKRTPPKQELDMPPVTGQKTVESVTISPCLLSTRSVGTPAWYPKPSKLITPVAAAWSDEPSMWENTARQMSSMGFDTTAAASAPPVASVPAPSFTKTVSEETPVSPLTTENVAALALTEVCLSRHQSAVEKDTVSESSLGVQTAPKRLDGMPTEDGADAAMDASASSTSPALTGRSTDSPMPETGAFPSAASLEDCPEATVDAPTASHVIHKFRHDPYGTASVFVEEYRCPCEQCAASAPATGGDHSVQCLQQNLLACTETEGERTPPPSALNAGDFVATDGYSSPYSPERRTELPQSTNMGNGLYFESASPNAVPARYVDESVAASLPLGRGASTPNSFIPPPPPPQAAHRVFVESNIPRYATEEDVAAIEQACVNVYYNVIMRWYSKVEKGQTLWLAAEDYCPSPDLHDGSFESYCDLASEWWRRHFEHAQKKVPRRSTFGGPTGNMQDVTATRNAGLDAAGGYSPAQDTAAGGYFISHRSPQAGTGSSMAQGGAPQAQGRPVRPWQHSRRNQSRWSQNAYLQQPQQPAISNANMAGSWLERQTPQFKEMQNFEGSPQMLESN